MYFHIFWRATLNETSTAKYDGVLPRTPKVRPKSEIYTSKWDDEHPPHPREGGGAKGTSQRISYRFTRLKTEQKIIRASSFNYYDDV